jgi:bile acid:Na+ symporter, BASS family
LPHALDLVYGVVLWITLWATAMGSGLAHHASEIVEAATNGRRFAAVVAVNTVMVPLVVAGLTRLVVIPEGYAAGLIIVGAASAGSLGLAGVRIARGDLPLAIGLIVALEIANLLTVPVWSMVLLAGAVEPRPLDIIGTLVLGVLLPLGIGLGLRQFRPPRAQRWARALARVSTVGFVLVVGLIVWRDLDQVVRAWGALVPLIALATVALALTAGWVAGGPGVHSRAASSLVSAIRANTPALAVASATYGATSEAVSAIVVFALVSLVVAGVTAGALRRASA